jgi:hypothetical protein
MSLLRRRLILLLGAALGPMLLARWTMLRDDPWTAPQRVETAKSGDRLPVEARPAPAAEISSPAIVASAADESASSLGTLRGRVIDAVTRGPVRTFEVEFHARRSAKSGAEAPGSRTFETKDGRFEWRRVPAGTWFVTVNARGYQRFELADLRISGRDSTPEIVIPMRPGYTLRGRVYDEVSGAGVASASIVFRESHVGAFEGNWRSRPRFGSQQDGTFVLEGIPAGRVTLTVYAQHYAGRELEVVVAEKSSELEIGLSTGATIAGRLTAADGVTPVAGYAGLFNIDRGFGGSSRTGEGGDFSFENLAPGRYRLTGQLEGQRAERDITLTGAERMEGIVLALGAGCSVRGVVTGLRPEELSRVSISLHREGDFLGSLLSVGVDSQGVYVLRGVQPGRVRVAADVAARRQMSRTVDVPADADVTVDIEFPRGARLSGRVTRGGRPLAGVSVDPRPVVRQDVYLYGTSTSTRGEYVLQDVATGEYRIQVGPYLSAPVQVSGDTVFDIDVPDAQLSGRVFEEGSKAPVVAADVQLWPAEPSAPRIRLHDRSDHFGQFALTGLEPGDLMLTVYKPGYEMYRERISYGSPLANMTIRLRRVDGVEIRVRDAVSGAPLRRVSLTEMIGDHNGSRLPLRLNENGVGNIPGALAGSTLSFSAFGYVTAVIREWDGRGLDLRLERERAR